MLKIVLTGGTCAGKTTLARALAARSGGWLVQEAAIQVITELRRELGLEAQARWRAANVVAFQERIAALQQRGEAEAASAGALRIVCDRGLPDGLAYFRHAGVAPPAELLEQLRSARYDAVFVLDTLAAFRPRPRSGRTDDRRISLALRDELLRVYTELGHAPRLVPELPPTERRRWIERELAADGWSWRRVP